MIILLFGQMMLYLLIRILTLLFVLSFFFFKQKTAYEMRISDWSSDVCSSDLIAGPETANNAGTGGAMVPTLALGIPGSGTTAIILAALMMHGFRPGPYLMTETPEFLYAIFTAMFLANFMFLFVGLAGVKVFSMITLVPRTFL